MKFLDPVQRNCLEVGWPGAILGLGVAQWYPFAPFIWGLLIITPRVLLPNNHILSKNPNLHNYYPKTEYLIIGSFGPLGFLTEYTKKKRVPHIIKGLLGKPRCADLGGKTSSMRVTVGVY